MNNITPIAPQLEHVQEAPEGTIPIPPVAPVGEAPAPAQDAPVEPESDSSPEEPKQISMPTATVARLKREAGQKANAKLLKQLGFKSVEDLNAALTAKRKGKPKAPRSRGARPAPHRPAKPVSLPEDTSTMNIEPEAALTAESPRQINRITKERDRLIDEKRRLNRARAHEEKRRKLVERERDSLSAEHKLRIAAVQAGVKDVDYAITLLRRQLEGKSEEEYELFDENAFFAKELRKSHPYLYQTHEAPADTGAETREGNRDQSAAAPTPASKINNPDAGTHQPIDPTKMTTEQYQNTLKRLGLTDPGAGMPA